MAQLSLKRRMTLAVLAAGLLGLAVVQVPVAQAQAQAPSQAPPSRFADWTAAVIAADWRDGSGRPIEAFDNARRDLTAAFVAAGFSRDNTVSYSLNPALPNPVTPPDALRGVEAAAKRATGGCLLYFTSHGSPEAMVFGDGRITPDVMANLVRRWCATRPTVVVVSACYSGIFLDALAAPNRIIMTAARRDRNSFGCGEGEVYPWFDGCVLEGLPGASDFIALTTAVRACVTRKETELGAAPPSEPQVRIGGQMQLLAPTLRFRRPPS